MHRFLQSLHGDGRLTMPAKWKRVPSTSKRDFDAEVERLDKAAREVAPVSMPSLHIEVTAWAARLFYGASFAVVHREVDEKFVAEKLGEALPTDSASIASAAYSADLVFRFLPDLHQKAKLLASDDPLTQRLEEVGASWPLSSVGMDLGDRLISQNHLGFADSPAMLTVYAERILAAGDRSRVGLDERIDRALRVALGPNRQTCPRIFDMLHPQPAPVS